MALDKLQLHALVNSLNERINLLAQVDARFENELNNDLYKLLNPRDENAESVELSETSPADDAKDEESEEKPPDLSPELIEYVHYMDLTLGNTFRYSILVGVCTFHVELLALFCKFAVPSYETALKQTKSRSDLSKHLEVLSTAFSFSLDPQLFQNLDDFREVRNSIIHDWGDVVNGTKAKQADAASKRLNATHTCFGRYGNALFIEDDGVSFAITLAQELAEAVSKELEKHC